MTRLFSILFLLLLGSGLYSQDLVEFNQKRTTITKRGMLSLGSWASVNLIGSTSGLLASETAYYKGFHQMNIMWNVVTIGLAIPSYIAANRENTEDYDGPTSYSIQKKKERIFAINTGLDLLYVGSGIGLMAYSNNAENNGELLRGYGASLIVQGGFLFSFDLIMTLVHHRHWKKDFDGKLNVGASANGIGLRWTI